MKELKLKKLSSLFIALVLPVQAAWALIPEPDNLVYGTVTLDGYPLTAANRDVSLVVKYAGREVSSYTMGDNPSMLNKYLLEIPVDSILQRNTNALRTGDKLEIYYQVGTSSSKAAELVVDERGTTKEINLQLTSEHIIVGADPSAIDSDGDGISDVYEVANGMNPLNASDAALDNDGDGLSNLQEYQNGTDINVDDNPPHLIPPLDRTVTATGLFTAVNLGVATAFDYKDGTLSATHDGNGVYAPGEHIVNWSVSDAAGNVVTATQLIKVIPLVNFHQDQLVAEGNTVTITAELNGLALQYPVTIPYTVSGTATAAAGDHNLASGQIVITGGLEGNVSFNVLDDAVASEGTESIVVTMGIPSNAAIGHRSIFTAQVMEDNITPTVSLNAAQDGGQTMIVVMDGALFVTISALADDRNPGDTLSFDWTATDGLLTDIDGDVTDDRFVFDPSGLVEGTYTVSVRVTDTAGAGSNAELHLQVVTALPVLASVDTDGDGLYDDQEGFIDSDGDGISDYLDALTPLNLMQADAIVTDHYLLETENGLRLALGYAAINAGAAVPTVSASDVNAAYNLSLVSSEFPGGLFNFTITGLSAPGDSASIVLPLLAAIPAEASYQQLILAGVPQLRSFTQDANNAVYSAPGSPGYCPSPGAAAYTSGLTTGNWCVMLRIEDGGVNDADGTANQRIVSLSGVKVPAATEEGGGVLSPLFILLLISGLGIGYRRKWLLSRSSVMSD